MEFGVKLRNISKLPVRETRSYLLEFARAADELGFYSLWVNDHIMLPQERKSTHTAGGPFPFDADEAYWEPLTLLASVASITKRVRLGTNVLVLPLRHPIYAAKVLATLDCLSNGRVIVGAGLGWLKEEMELLGAPTPVRPGVLSDEYIRLYKELWTNEQPRFEGQWFQFSGFKFLPKPVQKPHPPIWIGGVSHAALRRVVRAGDGWHSMPQTPEQIATSIQFLRQLCEQEGRSFFDLALSSSINIAVAKGAKGERYAELVYPFGGGMPALRGNPDQIAYTLRRYRDAGLGHMCAHCEIAGDAPGISSALQAAEIIAKEVIPQLRL